MLPGFLESRYKRYKNDTSTFIKWLYEASQKCGYTPSQPSEVDIQENTATKGSRLKGKARKEANAKDNQTSEFLTFNMPFHAFALV